MTVVGWLVREVFAAVGQVVSARTYAAFEPWVCDTEGERVLADLEADTEVIEPRQLTEADLADDEFVPNCSDIGPVNDAYFARQVADADVAREGRPACLNQRRHPTKPYLCTRALGHAGRHGWDGTFWGDSGDVAAERDARTPCEREHCLCKRAWRHGDWINRVEHERAAAEHLTPVEAANRRLAEMHPNFAHLDTPAANSPRGGDQQK